jgi:hypothetical protein
VLMVIWNYVSSSKYLSKIAKHVNPASKVQHGLEAGEGTTVRSTVHDPRGKPTTIRNQDCD